MKKAIKAIIKNKESGWYPKPISVNDEKLEKQKVYIKILMSPQPHKKYKNWDSAKIAKISKSYNKV